MRRPLVAAVLATGVLVALTSRRSACTPPSGIERCPRRRHEDADQDAQAFPGGEAPEQVVDRGQGRHHARGQGRDRGPEGPRGPHGRHQRAQRRVQRQPPRRRGRHADRGKGNDAKSYAALENIREDLVPATVGKLGERRGRRRRQRRPVEGLQRPVKALRADRVRVRPRRSRSCCCWSRSARSSIPIKAIVLNLLSVGAAYGVLCSSSSTAAARSCSASRPPGAIEPGSRCSCS